MQTRKRPENRSRGRREGTQGVPPPPPPLLHLHSPAAPTPHSCPRSQAYPLATLNLGRAEGEREKSPSGRRGGGGKSSLLHGKALTPLPARLPRAQHTGRAMLPGSPAGWRTALRGGCPEHSPCGRWPVGVCPAQSQAPSSCEPQPRLSYAAPPGKHGHARSTDR